MDWFLHDNGLRRERVKYIWLFSILTKLSVDVEENPGPKLDVMSKLLNLSLERK